MADPKGAFGHKWRIEVASVMTIVPELKEMDFPESDSTLKDVTAHDSTGGYERWLKVGVKKQPTVSQTVHWDATDPVHAQLLALEISGATTPHEFETAAGEVIQVPCIVKKNKRKGGIEDVIEAEITVQPSGAPTIVAPV